MKCSFVLLTTMIGRLTVFLLPVLSIALVAAISFGQEPAQTLPTSTDKPATATRSNSPIKESKIKVVFDGSAPGVVFVESNGEKIRIDTIAKTTAAVVPESDDNDSSQQAISDPKTDPASLDTEQEESAYDFERGDEPYDYRVVNIATPKNVPKGSWNLVFTHRFSQPIVPLSSSGKNLLGLDSRAIASFGVTYGITDKLYVTASRSPLCQKGLCRVIEIGLGYNWLSQDKHSPIAVTTYASIEGNGNFREEYTYNLQAMISGRLGKRVYLFFSPAVHLNANGQGRFNPRPSDYFPPATVADNFRLPAHGASFGFGASVLITPNVVALFDFTPRTGFKLGRIDPIRDSSFRVIGFENESYPSIGFGIQRNIGKHAFALTFSNTQTTTTSRYNSSNLVNPPKRLIIGFNLSRRL